MAEEMAVKQAQTTFASLCKMLDAKEMHYERDDEKLTITCVGRGDDFPVDVKMEVDPERMLILLFSQLPFNMSEDKLIEGAVATSMINYSLADGNFDYNVKTGAIIWRMTSSFRESLIGIELLEYMLMCSFVTVDRFNDKLFMLSKGMIGVDAFEK